MRRAFITGITGQDGSYLAELLLHKNYEVHGLIRRASTFNTGRINHIFDKIHLHHGDLSDGTSLVRLLSKIQPDEVYNLAAQSHVRVSFDTAEYTADVTGTGTLRVLEAIREAKIVPKFYQASSSEQFGSTPPPQSEITPFHPRSPYACAKVMAYHAVVHYREAYGLHASNGILFNHESPRRGETFVTRKITRWLGQYLNDPKHAPKLYLGNLDARRDWGYAPEYVMAMWLMLQMPHPGDYVIATGEAHSVNEFLKEAFAYANVDIGDKVELDKKYFRPTEVDTLNGDGRKAAAFLHWYPKVNFAELVHLMVDADCYGKEENLKPIWDRNYESDDTRQ
jgi:GDPmannose 4,6-dehydratase